MKHDQPDTEPVPTSTPTVAALVAAPPESGVSLILAATSAGLYRSFDAGCSWERMSAAASLPPIEAVAISPRYSTDRTIFAATGGGLFRSQDDGQAWHPVLVGSRIHSVAAGINDEDQTVVLVGSETDGVLRSIDGGESWVSANPGLLDLTVLALALSPDFAEDKTAFAGTETGVYRSRNAGRSWRAMELPVEEPSVQCLSVSSAFASDRLVLAGTEADGLLRSADGGTHWEIVPALAHSGVTAVACSAHCARNCVVAVAASEGVAFSDDGGTTWRVTGHELVPIMSLAFACESEGEALLAGLLYRGIARTENGGTHWALANSGFSPEGDCGSSLMTQR